MAKQGENRGEIKEVKRLYRVWSQVDGRIELPASLSARALLPRLKNVEQPVSPIGKIRFSPKIFTWQSGVTYAAAFALIVALSAVFTRGDQPVELLHGEIAADAVIEEQAPAAAPRALPDLPADADVPEIEEPAAGAPEAAAFAAEITADADAGATVEAFGVGGQSAAILLGTDESYSYYWRANDPSDPDKEGYPVTVDVVGAASGELASSIDLPGMLAVEEYYRYNDIIAFAGSGENSAVLYAADLSDALNPEPYLERVQEGSFTDSSLYGSTLHLLTLTETADGLGCEIVPLPGGESPACCVVTVVDLETRETASKAFSGVGSGEVYLYNLHAYMSYDGAVTEENATGKYLAQIRLDGMDIELTGDEDASGQEETIPEESEPTEPSAGEGSAE